MLQLVDAQSLIADLREQVSGLGQIVYSVEVAY